MRIADVGIGLGALAQGLAGGIQLGRQIRDARDENAVRKAMKEGLEQAKQQREQDITKLIQVNALPTDVGPSREFKVGDQTFKSEDEARKAAESLVDSSIDYFYQNHAPKIKDLYVTQGRAEQAEKWDQLITSNRGRKAMKGWATMWMNFNAGNIDKAVTDFGKYYSSYVDPSISVKAHKVVEGEGGPTVQLTLHDRDSGSDFELNLDRNSFTQLALAYNPADLAAAQIRQEAAATEARAKDALEQRKFEREQTGAERLELIRANREQALAEVKAQLRAKYGDAASSGMASIYRKSTSIEDMVHQARKLIEERFDARMMSEQEKTALAEQMVRDTLEAAGRIRSGMPGLQAGPQEGLMRYDKKTGELVPIDPSKIYNLPKQ